MKGDLVYGPQKKKLNSVLSKDMEAKYVATGWKLKMTHLTFAELLQIVDIVREMRN